jgi:hypothetical protein
MREILKGIVDMHVHNGPSTAARKYNTAEFCLEADKAGYKAFITKDHYFPSVMTAMQTNSLLEGKVKTKAYGSLILNNSVGGIALKAVDVACAMDVKYLSLPTLSSANHIEYYKGRKFAGESMLLTIEETPISLIDKKGNLTPEIENLLQYLSRKERAPILATGHGSREEIDAVVNRASELGVKILLNHPYYGFDAQIKFVEGWAKLGAYVELTAVWFLMQGSKSYGVISDLLSKIPMEKFVLDSDLGQAKNESPVDGLYRFIEILMQEFKVTEQQINLIGKETPSKLMGI